MTHILKAYELLKAGTIGKVHKVHCTWNRNAAAGAAVQGRDRPEDGGLEAVPGHRAGRRTFDAYRFRQWRWFWDFGGGIFTDLMVHWIDVVHWFLDLDHPATAASVGDCFSAKDVWETPDTVQTLMRYPEQEVQVYFEGTFSNNRNGAMTEFMGTRGDAVHRPRPLRGHPGPRQDEAGAAVAGPGHRAEAPGADFYDKPDGELLHLTNWVECVRDRSKKVACPAEAGVSAAQRRPPGEPVDQDRPGRGVEGVASPPGGRTTWPTEPCPTQLNRPTRAFVPDTPSGSTVCGIGKARRSGRARANPKVTLLTIQKCCIRPPLRGGNGKKTKSCVWSSWYS